MTRNVIGLIPAAGKGTRISPLPCSKELFPVGFHEVKHNGSAKLLPKVVSHYLIDQMQTAGVEEIVMVVSSGKMDILEYFGSGSAFDLRIMYLFDDNLRGMPRSMDLAWPWLQERTVVFGMPDTIFSPSDVYDRMLSRLEEDQADVMLGVFHTDRPQKLCVVRLDGEGKVVHMEDKPTVTDLTIAWGCGCWSPKFSAFMHQFLQENPIAADGKEIVLADIFLAAMEEGLAVHGIYFEEGEYLDVGTPLHLATAVDRFSNGFHAL